MAESSEEGGRPQTDLQSRASDHSSNEDYADSDADDGETAADRLDESLIRRSDEESDGSGAHSSSSGDDEDRQRNIHRRSQMLSTMTFDTSMPSSHSYLGETRSAAEGVALVGIVREDDAVPDLPVVSLHDIVLFPGQTLPLTLTRPAAMRAITALLEDGSSRRLLLVVNPRVICAERALRVGTTGEIRSYRKTTDALHLVVLGRQRVKLVGTPVLQPSGILTSTAHILPEPLPPRMPLDVMGTPAPHSCSRPSGAVACITQGQASPSSSSAQRGVKAWRGAGSAYWPRWCYAMFDAETLARQARARFQVLTGMDHAPARGTGASGDCGQAAAAAPHEPLAFSYWLSWNLLVGARDRQKLLECSVVERLRNQLHILKGMGALACTRCGLPICHHEQLFHMSSEGPVSAFVNPGGVVHETATFYKASNLVLVGPKSEEHSWFPGYAWTIALCAGCQGHIGWRFTAVSALAVPRHFWGLSRAQLRQG